MKMPLWKIVLSHVIDLHIESTASDYNEALHVKLVKGRFQLCTPDAIYSWADKYDNYAESFATMHLDKLKKGQILILGFGLGSIPFMLEKSFNKHYEYVGVDIDLEVLRLAGKYVLDELSSPITLIQADAFQYLQNSTEKFDLIASDLFINDTIPDVFLSETYFLTIKKRLTKQGILMLNMLYRTDADKKLADEVYADIFSKCFPDSARLRIKDNMMLFNRSDIFIHQKVGNKN